MHYSKFRRTGRSLYFSSLSLVFVLLLGLAVIGLGVTLWVTYRDDLIIPFGITVGIFLIFSLIQLILTNQCRCQLCRSFVLRPLKCSKVPSATPILGSYRLKVATTIIFSGRFTCPYCGEPFNLRAKPEEDKSGPRVSPGRIRRAGSDLPTRRR